MIKSVLFNVISKFGIRSEKRGFVWIYMSVKDKIMMQLLMDSVDSVYMIKILNRIMINTILEKMIKYMFIMI